EDRDGEVPREEAEAQPLDAFEPPDRLVIGVPQGEPSRRVVAHHRRELARARHASRRSPPRDDVDDQDGNDEKKEEYRQLRPHRHSLVLVRSVSYAEQEDAVEREKRQIGRLAERAEAREEQPGLPAADERRADGDPPGKVRQRLLAQHQCVGDDGPAVAVPDQAIALAGGLARLHARQEAGSSLPPGRLAVRPVPDQPLEIELAVVALDELADVVLERGALLPPSLALLRTGSARAVDGHDRRHLQSPLQPGDAAVASPEGAPCSTGS